MICIILGANLPFLIRKIGDHHIFLEPCFVWGLMDGEAVSSLEKEGRLEDVLETIQLH